MANGFRCGFSFLILWCNLQWLLSACSAQNTHKFLGLMDYLAGSQPAGPSEKKHLQILINMGRQGKIMEGLMDEARWVGFRTYPHTLSKLASKMATNKTSTLRWWQSVRLVVVRVQVVPAPRAETLERPIADSLTFRWCSPRGFPRFFLVELTSRRQLRRSRGGGGLFFLRSQKRGNEALGHSDREI